MFLKIKVIPKSSHNEIMETKDGLLKIKVTASPVEGQANEAVIKLLAQELGLKKSQISILKGQKSRIKTIELTGVNEDELPGNIELAKN